MSTFDGNVCNGCLLFMVVLTMFYDHLRYSLCRVLDGFSSIITKKFGTWILTIIRHLFLRTRVASDSGQKKGKHLINLGFRHKSAMIEQCCETLLSFRLFPPSVRFQASKVVRNPQPSTQVLLICAWPVSIYPEVRGSSHVANW